MNEHPALEAEVNRQATDAYPIGDDTTRANYTDRHPASARMSTDQPRRVGEGPYSSAGGAVFTDPAFL